MIAALDRLRTEIEVVRSSAAGLGLLHLEPWPAAARRLAALSIVNLMLKPVAVESGRGALCPVHWVIVAGGLWGAMELLRVAVSRDVVFVNKSLRSMPSSRICGIILPVVVHFDSDEAYSQNLKIWDYDDRHCTGRHESRTVKKRGSWSFLINEIWESQK